MSRSGFILGGVSFLFLFSVLSHPNHRPAPGPRVPERGSPGGDGVTLHSISLETAVRMTGRYRVGAPAGAPLAESFSSDDVGAILVDPRCVELKIYRGVDDEGRDAFVLIGVDSAGNDITGGAIAGRGLWCPPICGNSPLSGQTF